MFRMTAPTRIAFGLASLCLGLLCAATSMGLMPDLCAAQSDARKSLCEAVALQACLAAQARRPDGVKDLLEVNRGPESKRRLRGGSPRQRQGNRRVLKPSIRRTDSGRERRREPR